MNQIEHSRLVEQVAVIARAAGDVVMEVYQADFAVRSKEDASPVTEADERAEAVIIRALRDLTPLVPIVSEEAATAGDVPEVAPRFWLVDPLDGTKEFISRNGEFTVNIALVERGVPVLGVVFAPALRRLYAGSVSGGAFVVDDEGRRPVACREVPTEGLTVVASRSHGDDEALKFLLNGRAVAAVKNAGSSLKLCLVASGEADMYPRQGRTMEWDIAAGHAVLLAAGGEVMQIAGGAVPSSAGTVLRYGKPGYENPHFCAARVAA